MSRATLSLTVTGLLFSQLVLSQPKSTFITEEDMLGELPSVSSVARMVQPLNQVPASVTIIDQQLIKASGAMTWVDVFRLVPGFESYYINGNRYGIGYHGFGREFPNHLEIMVDGRPIYDPVFANTEWGSLGISLEDIDHIEIVRGSNAPAFGSNAFLGAVNIITRKPVQERGWQVGLTAGDQQTRETTVRYSGNAEKLDYRVSFNYQHNDGFPPVSSGDNRGPMKDGREMLALNLRAMYTPNITDTFDLQAGYTHNNSGWGDADRPAEYADVQFKNQYQSLKWNRDLVNGDGLQIHLYHNRIEGENFINQGLVSNLLSEELGFTITPEQVPGFFQMIDPSLDIEDQHYIVGFQGIDSERYDAELEHRLHLTPDLRATWGAGLRYDNISGKTVFGHSGDESLTSRRLFGHLEWEASSHWTLNAGLMIENNVLVDTIASGRIAANYHFNPLHTLRIGYAIGRRSPSLGEARELNVDILADQILVQAIRKSAESVEEERLKSLELGYLAQLPTQGLTFDVRLFRESVKDGIDTYQAPADLGIPSLGLDETISVRDNNSRWVTRGTELQLRYQPTERTLINAHYSYRDVDSFYISRYEPYFQIKDHDERAPRHTAGLLLFQRFAAGWSSGINIYHMTAADWRDGNPVEQFVRVDAHLGYDFTVGSSTGNLSLIGQNLGGDYMEHAQNNVFKTRLFLRLVLNF